MRLGAGDWVCLDRDQPGTKVAAEVKLSHTLRATWPSFDGPNLVSLAGLVPALALAERAGFARWLMSIGRCSRDKGAKAGVEGVLAGRGMVVGADSIDSMTL
jgi:hypothetical protein